MDIEAIKKAKQGHYQALLDTYHKYKIPRHWDKNWDMYIDILEMRAQGLTLEKIAEKLGVSRGKVSLFQNRIIWYLCKIGLKKTINQR